MAAIPPARSQADVSLRARLLNNGRASVAVASLVAHAVARWFFETQVHRFSLIDICTVIYTSFTLNTTFFFSFFCSFPVFRGGFYNQSPVFSFKFSKGFFTRFGPFLR